jgi:hypothetical protein
VTRSLSFAKRASDPCGEGLTGRKMRRLRTVAWTTEAIRRGESGRSRAWGRSRALVGGEASQAGLDYAARRT